MRNKFIPLVVALVFGSIAVVGFSQMMNAGPKLATVEIYVANRVINGSEEITQDAIQLEQWPADRVSEDAIQDWSKLEGKYAAQRLFPGEPILARKLDDRPIRIPKGFNTVDLMSDEIQNIANLVAPGDRVDVSGFFARSEVVPETTTKTVLSGIRVVAVDGRTAREAKPDEKEKQKQPAKSVTLLIHKQDAEVLAWARELTRISLTLGRPDDGGTGEEIDGPNPAGQDFLKWLTDYQAAKIAAEQAAKAEKNASKTPNQPSQSVVVEEPKKAHIQHQMMKIGGDGKISIYTWEEGNPVPVVTSPDEKEEQASAVPPGLGPSLEYLNGKNSPLFKDPSEDAPPQPTPPGNPFSGISGQSVEE